MFDAVNPEPLRQYYLNQLGLTAWYSRELPSDPGVSAEVIGSSISLSPHTEVEAGTSGADLFSLSRRL